jgi:glycosyltransferase involved in cell wall biosynthesis
MLSGLVVAVVVPAYNEERHVLRVLESMPGFVDRILVVDDASHDATGDRVMSVTDPRVTLLRHSRNLGVGAAIATGYARAFADGADVAVVMAADAQMDPRDLEPLIAPIARGEADYAKGDRLSWPDAARAMPPTRFVGNHALAALTRLATGVRVRDSQCGYTALSRDGARRLRLDALWPGYGYPNDLIASAAMAGLRIREVPVRPIYADETSGVGVRHALVVVPYVLARAALRRLTVELAGPAAPGPEPAE